MEKWMYSERMEVCRSDGERVYALNIAKEGSMCVGQLCRKCKAAARWPSTFPSAALQH